MSNEEKIEQRLAALEAEVAALKRHVGPVSPNGDWANYLPGAVTNDEVFQKMLEYGRKYRSAGDEPDDTETQS